MTRLKIIIRSSVILVAISTAPLFGQTTWGGLRFGMTVTEVKSALKDRVEPLADASGANDNAALKIKDVTVGPATGYGTMGFRGNDKTLDRIWLDFSRTDGPTSDHEDALRSVSYTYIADHLLEQYGRPANETGHCPTSNDVVNHFVRTPLSTIECTRLWREQSQAVRMKVSFVGKALFLTVEYKALAGSEL